MKKQLTHITPLKAGLVLGTMYGFVSLIIVPFILLAAGMTAGQPGFPHPFIFTAGIAIIAPFLYAIVGFIAGALSALIYNLIAKWTGGLEFEVKDLPAAV
jgi:hypothetical protein